MRYSKLDDVTSSKARDEAKRLQEGNDAAALKLANCVIRRLLWNYIFLYDGFSENKGRYSERYGQYDEFISKYTQNKGGYESIDVAGFVTSLWAKLSFDNDGLIDNVMRKLQRWILFSGIARTMPAYREAGGRKPGVLDGLLRFYQDITKKKGNGLVPVEKDLKLFISLMMSEIAFKNPSETNFSYVLERSVRDYNLLISMSQDRHIRAAFDLMLSHKEIFFEKAMLVGLEEKNEKEKEVLFQTASPYAQIFWLFCVLLCGELFEGDHFLSPNDAQLLGLIDEVSGGWTCE